jgi:hypothetical protein
MFQCIETRFLVFKKTKGYPTQATIFSCSANYTVIFVRLVEITIIVIAPGPMHVIHSMYVMSNLNL